MYNLVSSDDPILQHYINRQYDFSPQANLKTYVDGLREVMDHYDGVGLAANQVGLDMRVFVTRNRYAIFNPYVAPYHETEHVGEVEGCLSLPGILCYIERPKEIRVRYMNIDGDYVSETLRDLDARIFLHEYDHLGGILITDRQRGATVNEENSSGRIEDGRLDNHYAATSEAS